MFLILSIWDVPVAKILVIYFFFFQFTLYNWALDDIGFPMYSQVICGYINQNGVMISKAVPQKVTNVWTSNTFQNLLTQLRSIYM